MANPEAKRLAVDVIARIDKLEKGLAKAKRAANDNFGAIEKRGKAMTSRLEADLQRSATKIGGLFSEFGKGIAGGIAAGGIAGLAASVSAAAKGLASIGDEAKRAGLGIKAFQELKYVAEQNRIGVDALVDGIKELNLRADEFIATGQGSAAEAFQRLGYDAETLRDKLRDPSALFSEIIGKLGQLDKAAQIRIADEVFGGTGGEKFVQLIGQGEAGIRDTIKAANDLGIVVDESLIKKADELDRKFQAVTTTVGTALKTAIVEAADALGDFIDRFREVEQRQTDTIVTQLREAERNLKAAQDRLGSYGGFFDEPLRKQVEASQKEVDRLRMVLRDRALERIRPQLESWNSSQGAAPKQDRLGYTPPVAGAAGASAAKAADSFDRLNAAVGRYVDQVVKAESGGNASAKNPLSSATGLGQFIESTWLQMFKQEFPDRAASMSRETILALRTDAEVSRQLIEAYARDNANLLRQAGVAVNEAALHLAHFLGPGGAIDVLKAAPGTPVSSVLGADAINANPTILGYGATVDDVIAYAERRAQALQGEKAAVDELGDAWAGLREKTATATDTVNAQADAYTQLGQIGQTALSGLEQALADGKIEGRELLGILFDIARQLLSMPSGGGGGIGGFLGGLLGFDQGGYTGPGPRKKAAGIVHKGEVVWNQDDVRRHGGPAAVDAMRRGVPGYDVGGIVGRPVPSLAPMAIPQRAGAAGGQSGVHVTVGVSADNNGNLLPFVESVAQTNIKRAAPAIVQQSTKTVQRQMPGMIADTQSRHF
jgi:hypothetical protein